MIIPLVSFRTLSEISLDGVESFQDSVMSLKGTNCSSCGSNECTVSPFFSFSTKNELNSQVHEFSSRSHAIYMYRVHIKDKMSAVLFLVDLAGSERLKISEAKGVRKTETQHINKSLSALGDVCAALDSTSSSKRSTSHIPYRNSKLTLLLKDALGGNTTTCIIATVSPENACSHEPVYTVFCSAL